MTNSPFLNQEKIDDSGSVANMCTGLRRLLCAFVARSLWTVQECGQDLAPVPLLVTLLVVGGRCS